MDEKERAGLLESLKIQFPAEETVKDKELPLYMLMTAGANTLIDECLRLRRELEAANKKLNCMSTGFESIADEEGGDVIFQLKRGTTRAPSSIVSSWSEPLAAMLLSGMCEGRNKCIEITTEEPTYVRMMLKYLYTARAPVDTTTVFPLLRLSCLYAIDTLRDQCCKFLLEHITAENCMAILNIAELHQPEGLPIWDTLQTKAKEYATQHFCDIIAVNSSPFSEMSVAQIVEFFRAARPNLLEIEGANVENARLLSGAIILWAKHHWPRATWPKEHWNLATLPHTILRINSNIAEYKMQLFVKMSGTTVSVFIRKTSNVLHLKEALKRSTGIPVVLQRLTFEGRVLLNDLEFLTACGIVTDSTIHLSVSPKLQTKRRRKNKLSHTGVTCDEGDYLEQLRDHCIAILAIDFSFQSRLHAFLELDYETFLSIITEDRIKVLDAETVVNAAYAWVSARADRTTNKIIDKIANSGCPHLTSLPGRFSTPSAKKKRLNTHESMDLHFDSSVRQTA